MFNHSPLAAMCKRNMAIFGNMIRAASPHNRKSDCGSSAVWRSGDADSPRREMDRPKSRG